MCELITDLCTHLDPCLNSATCVNEDENYTCICVPGFTGQNCQEGGLKLKSNKLKCITISLNLFSDSEKIKEINPEGVDIV